MIARPLLAVLLVAMPLAFAGCLASESEPGPVDPAASVAGAERIPISHQGEIRSLATACPVATCVGVNAVSAGETWFPQEARGFFSTVDLNLSWDASSPLMDSLLFGFLVCANECATDEDVRFEQTVMGSSPLSLAMTDVTIAEDEAAYVYAARPGRTPAVYVALATPQTFQIDGVMVPAAAGAAMATQAPAEGAAGA